MKTKIFLLLIISVFLTSCDSVFVWTVKDIAGLVFIGIVILVILGYILYALYLDTIAWFYRTFKSKK